LIALSLVFLAVASQKVNYAGHSVVRLQIENDTQREYVNHLVEKLNLDVWSEYLDDIRLPPMYKDIFTSAGIKQTVFIPDLQDLMEEVEVQQNLGAPGDFFDAYRRTADVMTFLNDMKAKYPDLVTVGDIGKTGQGKPIVALHIQSKKGPATKPRIVFNGGQHAREWVTVTTINYFIDQFLTGYGTNDTFTKLIDNVDWTFVPILNVDGYDYTWSNDRMWRKNRRPNSNGCFGVDNNRNWPYMWNRGGSSSNPCSDTYYGPGAGSEPENSAIANYLKNTPRVGCYIDWHSYTQLWMSPYGYSTVLPADYSKHMAILRPGVLAIEKIHGQRYVAGPIASTIYVASGNSVDYAYSIGILHSYTFELRDTGRYGFILPPAQIIPQGEEVMAAVFILGDVVSKEFQEANKLD